MKIENSSSLSKSASNIIDVFISYKSEDTEYAKEIYDYLKSHNFQVFFSKESLPQLGSDEYHEQIDTAIERTRHMVVVSSSIENVLAKWVKYEWRLFLGEKLAGRKAGNLITVIAGEMKIQDLPIALRNREVITLIPGELDKLQKYIEKNQSTEAKQDLPDLDIIASNQEYSRQIVALSDFTVAKTEILKNISWNAAFQHANTLSIGGIAGWQLPTLEQLAIIQNSSLFPEIYCYWSSEEAGAAEALYMHFHDGHTGRGPKTFSNGLCAVFVKK
jgi:hypothetical protein